MSKAARYQSLTDLVEAIRLGTCPNAVLLIDNDSVTMRHYPDDQSLGELLFDGDTPRMLLVEALDLLGVPHESV